MTTLAKCRHCGRVIRHADGAINAGVWVHHRTGSKWCDQSGTTEAKPR